MSTTPKLETQHDLGSQYLIRRFMFPIANIPPTPCRPLALCLFISGLKLTVFIDNEVFGYANVQRGTKVSFTLVIYFLLTSLFLSLLLSVTSRHSAVSHHRKRNAV